MKYKVYMHKLKSDNRVYIGITKQEVYKRWQNGLGYVRSSYFYKAIQKYGWDNFEHIILLDDLTKEEAEQKEKELIKKYKANIKGYGFNLNEGGFAPTITEKQKRKISETEKGKIISKETIKKANETKRKRYETIGLTIKEKERYIKRTKTVKCIETDKKYFGQKELEKYGLNGSNIYEVCNGNRKSAYGYHWCFVKG